MKKETKGDSKKKKGLLKKTLILVGAIIFFAFLVTLFSSLYSSISTSGNLGNVLKTVSNVKDVSLLIQILIFIVLFFFWDDLCQKLFLPEKSKRMKRLKLTTIPMTIILLLAAYVI